MRIAFTDVAALAAILAVAWRKLARITFIAR